MAELKKCPFCGGEAEIDWYEDDGNETHWFVCCSNCSCELSFGAKISREQAIEAWNNRVTEADIRAKAIKQIPDLAEKWNATNRGKVPYEFVHWLAEQLKGE